MDGKRKGMEAGYQTEQMSIPGTKFARGRVLPIAEVRRHLAEQNANARALGNQIDTAGLSMPGCPLAWD